jgi:hypothetical protein
MAAPNPFLDAIQKAPNPLPDFKELTSQVSIPTPHGVDLSNVPEQWDFQLGGGFTKSSSSSSSALPAQVAQAQHGNWLSSLWNDIVNAWNKSPLGRLQGAAEGFITAFHDNQGHVQAPHNAIDFLQGMLSPLYGYANPQQEAQKYEAVKQQMGKGVLPWVVGTLADTVTNPLTALPIGEGVKAIGAATGLPKLFDALKQSAPEAVRVPLNTITSLFKPIAGARQPFLNAVSRMTGKVQSGTNQIMKTLQDIFKGTTPEQRVALTHALESTPVGTPLDDPVLESLRQKIEPLMEQATQHSLQRGLITKTINPADFGVARYIPHVNIKKLDLNEMPFADVTRRNPNIDASKARNLEGTIRAINEARGEKVFEDDLAKILAYHLAQINKATAERDLIDEAMQHGIPVGGELKAGDQFPGTFQKAVEYTSPHTGETVLLPESEARYLEQLRAPSSEYKNAIKKAYQGTVNAFNQLMFTTSPFIHILNNLGTQTLTHAPGIFLKMPKYLKEAWKGVEPGSKMDEALQSGALHLSSLMHGASTPKKLANQLVKDLDSKPNPLRSFAKAYMELTPRIEQAYRAAAFEHALEKGMTPDEAANWIRSIYGGRIAGDAVSPAEAVATTFMPFFNWTKTAIKSNVKNAANNPAPYVALFNALNNYNEQVTGHGMADNPNPLSIALPWKDKAGNQEYWSLYAPPFDVAKLVKDVAEGGPRGLLDFAFTRTNPIVRYAGQVASGEQNPFANPLEKYNVEPYPALPAQFNKRGVFFGDKGPQAPAYVAQFAQDVINPFAAINDVQEAGPLDTAIMQLLGGYINAPNPQSQQKQEQWQNNEILKEFRAWLKKQAGGQ